MVKIINQEIIHILKNGGVGILPTDTLYGLVGSALNPKTVERIYQLRQRNPAKPMIILISSLKDLGIFSIHLKGVILNYLKKIWPNPVSVVLSCPGTSFFYLHRGSNTLAFRIPKDQELLTLLKKTGPLVAPSANLEGKPEAKTITEAKNYFGGQVDFYLDKGKLISKPSTLIKLEDGRVIVLRLGAFSIDAVGDI